MQIFWAYGDDDGCKNSAHDGDYDGAHDGDYDDAHDGDYDGDYNYDFGSCSVHAIGGGGSWGLWFLAECLY